MSNIPSTLPIYPIPQPDQYQYPVAALLEFYPFTSRADYEAKMGVPCPDYDKTQPVMNWVDPAAIGGTYTGPYQITTINGIEYILYPSFNRALMPQPVLVPVALAGKGNMLPDHFVSGATKPPGTPSVYRALLPNEILVAGPTPFTGTLVQRTDIQAPAPASGGDSATLVSIQNQLTSLQQELNQIALALGVHS